MPPIRIDKLLFEKNLAPSRERAQSLIMAGVVYVGTKRVEKASELYLPDAPIQIKGEDHPYVSRGGVKLEGALNHFGVDPKGKICLDVGASTGGFTDCLLQKGAEKIYALDVGYGQLAWKLRQDPRVVVIEKKNARELKKGDLPQTIDLIVIDLSFISLTKVIQTLLELFSSPFAVLALIKPQFEVGRKEVPKGGVVLDPRLHQQVIDSIQGEIENRHGKVIGVFPSQLKGADGNQEYFILFEK